MNRCPSGEGVESATVDADPNCEGSAERGMAWGPSHVAVEEQGWDVGKH